MAGKRKPQLVASAAVNSPLNALLTWLQSVTEH
jgi:hypothetical protein